MKTKKYQNISQTKLDIGLKTLVDDGADIEGDNPWQINTNRHGIILEGKWDSEDSVLTISISDKNHYVSNRKIWKKITPLINA
jgi:hypothetical protein